METLREQTKKTENLLLRKTIINIVGSHNMQNEMLSYFLEKETSARCIISKNINKALFGDERGCENYIRLGLFDYQGKAQRNLLEEINSFNVSCTQKSYAAVFNLANDPGIEAFCLHRGVRGFFYKDDSRNRFLSGVRAVCTGELWVSWNIISRYILKGKVKGGKTSNQETVFLTPRQMEILALLSMGVSNKKISEKLCISDNTVKTHLYNIYKVIKVSKRMQAANWAVNNLHQQIIQLQPSIESVYY